MDIIKHLDELRAKATTTNWRIEREIFSHDDAEYLGALTNAYPALRQAVLDCERYKVAGMKLYNLCSKLTPEKCDEAEEAMEVIIKQAEAGNELFNTLDNLYKPELPSDVYRAIEAYRTAIDDSSK